MNRVDNLRLICIPTRVTLLLFSSESTRLIDYARFCAQNLMIILCVDMVGNGAGPGGDTVIDMPADQQEKKSLV